LNILAQFRSSLQSSEQKGGGETLQPWENRFPYFALLKWMKAQQHAQDIFPASIYSPDRQRLHHYIKGYSLWPSPMLSERTQQDHKKVQSPTTVFSETLEPHIPTNFSVYSISEPTPIVEGKLVFHISNELNNEIDTVNPYLQQRCIQARALASRQARIITAQLTQFKLHSAKVEPLTITPARYYSHHSEIAEEESVAKSTRLIDQFLDNLPTRKATRPIPSPEEETGSETAHSVRASIEVDEELVSETLARLFVRQKNYEEAIAMYKKLSLRFPDKSRYFDAQIDKIKQD